MFHSKRQANSLIYAANKCLKLCRAFCGFRKSVLIVRHIAFDYAFTCYSSFGDQRLHWLCSKIDLARMPCLEWKTINCLLLLYFVVTPKHDWSIAKKTLPAFRQSHILNYWTVNFERSLQLSGFYDDIWVVATSSSSSSFYCGQQNVVFYAWIYAWTISVYYCFMLKLVWPAPLQLQAALQR